MIEKTLWHPVGKAVDLAGSPKAVVLLEEDVVIWQTPDGRFQAWADRCPHRGAKLSLGRVQDGQLECAYHGWQFDQAGQCKLMPALPAFTPAAGYRACTHEAREAYGLAWVRLAPRCGQRSAQA